jgi:hypothetical protein
MTSSSHRRRAKRHTPDSYQPRPAKRFTEGLGPWLLAAFVVALLFGIVVVTH